MLGKYSSMTLRQDLFDLARHFGLAPAQGAALHAAAGLDAQPAAASRLAVPVLTLLAAMLAGFGVILWIAANWGLWSRPTHFALLGSLLLASSAGSRALASRRRGSSLALGIIALATLGGLLAYFGQTYQTGANPWQLFALWTGLALPLCLGLRSRVLWIPWSLIANTALSLWAWSQLDRWSGAQAPPELEPLLLALAASALLSLALHPASRRWTGSDLLAHRIAVFWTVLLTGSLSLLQFLTHMGQVIALLPGLALMGAAMAWYGMRRHFDVFVLSAATLATLILLFALLAEKLLGRGGLDAITLTLLGLAAMLALAAAVAWIMRRHRMAVHPAAVTPPQLPRPAAEPPALACALDLGIAQGWWTSREHGRQALQSDSSERPWAVVLLTALGAWLAVLPFVSALTMFASSTETMALTLGAVLFGGSLWLLRRPRLALFLEQLAYALLVTGLAFITLGATGLWNERTALWGLAALLLVLVGTLREPWLQWLLGAALCTLIPMLVASLLPRHTDYWLLDQPWSLAWLPSVIALAWPAAMLLRPARWQGLPLVPYAARREAFWAGWMLTVLVQQAVSAGMTFMIGGMLGGSGGGTRGWNADVLTQASGLQFWQWWLPLSSGLFAVAGYAIAAQRWPLLRTPALGLLAVLLTIAAWFLPSLGIPLCFLATAAVTQRWRLAAASAVTAGWVVGAIYYQTDYLLVHKALSLLALAVVVGAVALWLQRNLGHRGSPALADVLPATGASVTGGPSASLARWRRHLILLAPLGTAAILLPGMLRNEALIRHGERLLIRLAPVDPRSLLQGDYMALAFELSPDSARAPENRPMDQREAEPRARPATYAVFRLAANGVASVQRLEYDESRPALAADERRIRLGHKRGQPFLVTDAWHFKEGTGERWARAAYGDFRLRSDGRTLLVGLADAQRQPIGGD